MSINSIKIKKPLFKHGWNEYDQIEVPDVMDLPYHYNEEPQSDSDSSTQSSSQPRDSYSYSDSSDSQTSKEDFTWDDTPEQFELQKTFVINSTSHASTPKTLSTVDPLPPPFTRNRIPAFNQSLLHRQHAFCEPPTNRAFLSSPSPQSNPREDKHEATSSKSRIPKPLSPTQVHLHEVSDFSLLPIDSYTDDVKTTRRSTRIRHRPTYYGCTVPAQQTSIEDLKNRDQTDGNKRGNQSRQH